MKFEFEFWDPKTTVLSRDSHTDVIVHKLQVAILPINRDTVGDSPLRCGQCAPLINSQLQTSLVRPPRRLVHYPNSPPATLCNTMINPLKC